MTLYNKVNNAVGWLVMVLATAVYMLTVEPTGSFWDCGEFVSCAVKLQIAHSPGAPFFLILGRIFTLFAGSPEKVALMVNFMSNIMGGGTSLFLFWTITAIGKKIIGKKETEMGIAEIIAVMGAGFVGAMASTFTDSLWFSAVEGEVYSSSSFFTALVFWAIFKWENVADEKYADRWIVFIGYMMGLSIGIHLLNLLAIPALVFVYYFKKTKQITRSGVIKTFLIACAILVFIQYGIIPGIPDIAAGFDIFFVNSLGMPFNSGVIVWGLIVLAAILGGFYYAYKKNNYTLHTAMLTLTFIIIGYSSYAMVLIRANANTSINMSNPKNAINLVSYLDREQYGDRPLLYGQYYTAKLTRQDQIDWESGKMKYWRGEKKYEELGRKPIINYDAADKTIFPRMFDGDDQSHVRFYREWMNIPEGQKPTFAQNLGFFFSYQVNYMYWRYFLWNFAGRQNDLQGLTNDVQKGNWISGINFIDNARLGPQDTLPPSMANNKAKNKFYFLPLILGLIGMAFNFKREKLDAWVVMLLFFFTGLAIVLYLNQTPLQPRERDYAYAGSIYAFCIWIGIGVIAVYDFLKNKMNAKTAAIAAFVVCLIVPGIMGAQGWDDHDRSHRYTARDFGRNYLESCPKDAILFTQGDNDTYPLWYAQEVEGIRPDVRIANLSLLGVDWYIDNLRRKVNESEPLPISIPSESYRGSNHDITRFAKDPRIDQNQYYNAKEVVKFMVSKDPSSMSRDYGENFLPTKKLYIPVDKEYCIKNGVVDAKDSSKIVSRVEWTLPKSSLLKPDLLVLDMIQNSDWKRPICFAISVSSDAYLGLGDYLQQEGLIYRLVPVKQSYNDGLPGTVNTRIMYDNVMHKFAWGGVDKFNVYLDENILRMVSNLRSNFARLSNALILEGDTTKAIEVLDKCITVLPERNVPYSLLMLPIAQSYYKAGAYEKGKPVVEKLFEYYLANLKYYASLNGDIRSYYKRDINEAVYVLAQLDDLTKTFKVDDLEKRISPAFEQYKMMYSADSRGDDD